MNTRPVTVYSKPTCVQCDATYRALDKHGIAYDVVDLTQDPTALELVRSSATSRPPSSSLATPTGLDSDPTRSPPSPPD